MVPLSFFQYPISMWLSPLRYLICLTNLAVKPKFLKIFPKCMIWTLLPVPVKYISFFPVDPPNNVGFCFLFLFFIFHVTSFIKRCQSCLHAAYRFQSPALTSLMTQASTVSGLVRLACELWPSPCFHAASLTVLKIWTELPLETEVKQCHFLSSAITCGFSTATNPQYCIGPETPLDISPHHFLFDPICNSLH